MDRQSITFSAKIDPVKPLNDELTLCRCTIMATGKNDNLSYIGQKAAEDAMPTLANVPVVGHIYYDERDGSYHMGEHDMTIYKDENGKLLLKSLCVPFGVVPESCNPHFEVVHETRGGVERDATYLVGDVILWTGRFPELLDVKYSDKVYFNQSMEINVRDYGKLEEDPKYTEIKSYSYSALCLLGKSDEPEYNEEPCFPESKVEPYVFEHDEQFASLKDEFILKLHDYFANVNAKGTEMENTEQTNVVEGVQGTEAVEAAEPKTEATFAQEEPVAEPAAEEAAEEATEEQTAPAEEGSAQAEEAPAVFGANYKKSFATICHALHNLLTEFVDIFAGNSNDEWVGFQHWTLDDFDEEKAYITCSTNLYFPNEEHNVSHYRVNYAFDEEKETAIWTSEYEEMFVEWLTKAEKEALENMRANYSLLVKEKADRDEQDRRNAYDAALGEFADLEGNEDYDRVASERYSYASVDELRNACYIIKGKLASTHNFARQTNTVVSVPISKGKQTLTARERLHEEYGKH